MSEIDRLDGEPLSVGVGPERSEGPTPTVRTPDPEVAEKPVRRRFGAKYKRRILEAADACAEPGEIGALLRREGLYSSHLAKWRQQREQGALAGLRPKQRGPKADPNKPAEREMERLVRENERLRKQLRQAEMIIDIQKKASEILGITLESPESSGDE